MSEVVKQGSEQVAQDPRETRKVELASRLLELTNEGFMKAFLDNSGQTASYAGLEELLKANGLPSESGNETYYTIQRLCSELHSLLFDLKKNPSFELVTKQKEALAKAQQLLDEGKLEWKISQNTYPSADTEVVHGTAEVDGYRVMITQTHTWPQKGKPHIKTSITGIVQREFSRE